MRMVSLFAVAALLLAACASGANLKVGGKADGRYAKGAAGIGIPF